MITPLHHIFTTCKNPFKKKGICWFNKKKIALLVCLFIQISCYKMTTYSYLFIDFKESRISGSFLKMYIDSVLNKNLIVPDSVNYIFLSGNILNDQERIIHFKNEPDEWYMINFTTEPCWIGTIYNKKLADTLINNRTLLGKNEIQRVEKRFQTEVLKQAELYGKKKCLPDSVIYKNLH
ncbi:hypothetical protein [Mucilaginibacter sp.]|uniref:hypothetical protein n=1 Tax=Mucilaginibacter sp. TaxID=1882438 RepID=UPI0026073FBE|nr:hypothetical protein [Mucilaginibacter sp.]